MPAPLKLRPSDASRWMVCKASPGFLAKNADRLPEEKKGKATTDGERAHTLAEAVLTSSEKKGAALLAAAPREMAAHVEGYVQFVLTKRAAMLDCDMQVEMKLNSFHQKERDCYLDVVLSSPTLIHIIDLKYGMGVSVEAVRNPQLAIYLKSYLVKVGRKLRRDFPIRLTIYQPRAMDGRFVRTWETTYGELEEYAQEILDTAIEIQLDPDGQPFHADENKTCLFCNGKAICRSYAEAVLAEVPADTRLALPAPEPNWPAPEALPPALLVRVLRAAPALKAWLKAAESHARACAQAGKPLPGTKLVAGRNGARQWKDTRKVEKELSKFLDEDIYAPRDLVSPKGLETVLKEYPDDADRIWKRLEKHIVQSPGESTVAFAEDKREAIGSTDQEAIDLL